MSITTHTSTIRQYIKNHTKDDIAIFFEDQFAKKDAEIGRLKDRCEFLEKVAEQAKKRADLRLATHMDVGYCELTQRLPVWEHRDPELAAWLKEKERGSANA